MTRSKAASYGALKQFISLCMVMTLSSCGFESVDNYQNKNHNFCKIKLAPMEISIKGEPKLYWEFKQELEDELHRGCDELLPTYLLKTNIGYETVPAFIRKDTVIARYNLRTKLYYQLYYIVDNRRELITTGVVHTVSSIDATGSPLTTIISDRGNKRMMLQNLIAQLKHHLYLQTP